MTNDVQDLPELSTKSTLMLGVMLTLGTDGPLDKSEQEMIIEFRAQLMMRNDDFKAAEKCYELHKKNQYGLVLTIAATLNRRQKIYLIAWLAKMLSQKKHLKDEEDAVWSMLVSECDLDQAIADGIAYGISITSGLVSYEEACQGTLEA